MRRWIVEAEREDGYALVTQTEPELHQAFARVVVQMQDDSEEDPRLLARLRLIEAAPQMLQFITDLAEGTYVHAAAAEFLKELDL